ncbi:MAG: DUF2207 family protein [Microbacteriaceae bacterium]
MKKILAFIGALFLLWVPSTASAGVDDFSFDSFDAEYELSRDDNGHSVLRVSEVLVARFPDFDQNRGIRRLIPETYLDNPLELELVSVTDGSGVDRPYETESDGEFLIVTIAVPEGEFVRGVQTYEITYVAHNVILSEGPDQPQELYWDINGDGWPQTFGSVSAEIRFDPSIAGAFTDQAACYAGDTGTTTPCSALETSPTTVTASHGSLGSYQTLTVAAQFAAETFTPRDNSYWASPWWPLHSASALAMVALLVASVIRRFTVGCSAPGRPTIVAEYGPPPGVSLYTVSALLSKPQRAFAAAVVDLAVRGVIVIEEFDPPGFGKRAWAVRLITLPSAAGQEFVAALFGDGAAVGARATVSKPSRSLTQRVVALAGRAGTTLVALGLRRMPPGRGQFGLLAILLTIVNSAVSIGIVAEARGDWIPAVTLLAGFVAGMVSLIVSMHTPLTAEGAEVRDHVAGLDLYIRVAEADRLRVLQSPSGALKKPIDTSNSRTVVHLYELVLPWAILLGREKDWARVLEIAYSGESPAWYAGSVPFTASAFSSSLSTLTSAAAASSTAGSGGGGSAGGGGGGGGGGGV